MQSVVRHDGSTSACYVLLWKSASRLCLGALAMHRGCTRVHAHPLTSVVHPVEVAAAKPKAHFRFRCWLSDWLLGSPCR